MTDIMKILEERGFIEQLTHETEIKELMQKEKISFSVVSDRSVRKNRIIHSVSPKIIDTALSSPIPLEPLTRIISPALAEAFTSRAILSMAAFAVIP